MINTSLVNVPGDSALSQVLSYFSISIGTYAYVRYHTAYMTAHNRIRFPCPGQLFMRGDRLGFAALISFFEGENTQV